MTRIICGADVRTLGEKLERAEAIAWRDGVVIAVGTRSEVELAAGAGATTWDASGASVLPGFIDAHHHPCITALYGGAVRLSRPEVTNVASLQRALARAVEKVPKGEWVVATDWDEELLDERRAPTRRELDDAAPDHPLFAMHYSCHRGVANSKALEAAGIGARTADPSGGRISRGPGGAPDGLLVERGMSRVEAMARAGLVARDSEGFLRRLGRHHVELVAAGITYLVDAVVPPDLMVLYREAAKLDLIKVPTSMMPVSIHGYLEEPRDALDGPVTGTEDGPLRVGPLKLVFDGAPACAMCLGWWQAAGVALSTWSMTLRQRSLAPIRASLSVQPRLGRRLRTGVSIYRREEAEPIVRDAVARGFSLAIHAIGNDAVDVALSAYERAGAALDRSGMPRVEHATFLDRELVARIAAVGAAVVAQPHFVSLPAYAAAASIPGIRNSPLRWLLDAGVCVAGSSDYPVAGFDPLDGVRSAVARRTSRGHVYEPDQRITLEEALVMYTRAAAKACGVLDRRGTLEPGKRADFVVLDRRLDDSTLAEARVAATVIGGDVLHGELR